MRNDDNALFKGPYRYQASRLITRVLAKGHPWIHRGALSSAIEPLPTKSLVRIVDGRNTFLAYAIYEPLGSVAMRVVSRSEPFGEQQLAGRLATLAARKLSMRSSAEGAIRLVHGEGDGFPGLTCDLYGSFCVWQPYLAFWDPFLTLFAETVSSLAGETVHCVKHPSIREEKRSPYLLAGGTIEEPVVFEENGIRLCSFPLTGQKTGFFLDLRPVREILPSLVSGGRVLNCFANSGAFSVIARLKGANSVLSVEESETCAGQYAAMLEANGMRMAEDEWITGDGWSGIRGLGDEGREFDLVIIDPPNMCTRKGALPSALKGWGKLARDSFRLLAPGGMLLLVNCSAFMTRELCEGEVKNLALPLSLWRTGGLPDDHTVKKSFPEGKYLKWWIYSNKVSPGNP